MRWCCRRTDCRFAGFRCASRNCACITTRVWPSSQEAIAAAESPVTAAQMMPILFRRDARPPAALLCDGRSHRAPQPPVAARPRAPAYAAHDGTLRFPPDSNCTFTFETKTRDAHTCHRYEQANARSRRARRIPGRRRRKKRQGDRRLRGPQRRQRWRDAVRRTRPRQGLHGTRRADAVESGEARRVADERCGGNT